MDVAVVIPCYQMRVTLVETLASVRALDPAPAEVVVVDDGSTDGSAEVAESFGVRVIRQENRGPGAARNAGIRATKAPAVTFLDADDLFVPNKIGAQLQHLESTGADVSCTDATIVRNGVVAGRKSDHARIPAEIQFADLLHGNPIVCSTVMARRAALDAVGGFDEDPALIATEDYDLWIRLVQRGRITYLAKPLTQYRVCPTSLSDDLRFLAGVDKIMEKVLQQDTGDLVVPAAERRAGIRTDAAYHLACQGRGREARILLREARSLVGWDTRQLRVWVRSWMRAKRQLGVYDGPRSSDETG